MALPKLLTPEFSVQLPSNKQPLNFRPFLVKEEKVLYMALEGGDPADIQKAVLDVLGACILTPDIQISQLTSYDNSLQNSCVCMILRTILSSTSFFA